MKFNSNQRFKVIQGLRSFKDTLPTKVKKLLKQKGEVYSELIENWRMFVGDELFSLSYPKKYLSSNKFRIGSNGQERSRSRVRVFEKKYNR